LVHNFITSQENWKQSGHVLSYNFDRFSIKEQVEPIKIVLGIIKMELKWPATRWAG
jgi:hypothetical protein